MGKTSPRHNREAKTTQVSCWLVFDSEGFIRMTKTEPGTNRYERKVKVDLTFPWSLFTQPELRASIQLEGEPSVIPTAETVRQIEDVMADIPGAILEIAPKE